MATNRTRTPIRHVNGQPTVRIRISQQPSTVQFGRAAWLDREEIQDAPIGPEKPRLWRSLGIALALLPAVIIALILLGIHDGVCWFAERIRSIVRAL